MTTTGFSMHLFRLLSFMINKVRDAPELSRKLLKTFLCCMSSMEMFQNCHGFVTDSNFGVEAKKAIICSTILNHYDITALSSTTTYEINIFL